MCRCRGFESHWRQNFFSVLNNFIQIFYFFNLFNLFPKFYFDFSIKKNYKEYRISEGTEIRVHRKNSKSRGFTMGLAE